jgi:hypothetical protein
VGYGHLPAFRGPGELGQSINAVAGYARSDERDLLRSGARSHGSYVMLSTPAVTLP